MLKYAASAFGTRSEIFHGILNDGSSKQGKMRRIPSGSPCVSTYHRPFSCCRCAPWLSCAGSLPCQWIRSVAAPAGSGWANCSPTNPGCASITVDFGSVSRMWRSCALSHKSGVAASSESSIVSVPWNTGCSGSTLSSAVMREGFAPAGSLRWGGMTCCAEPSGRTNRSANRSLVPRLPAFAAAPGDEFQSRASCGLRKKSLSPARRKPAFCTSSFTTCSSMRCSVAVSAMPAPGLALESITTNTPPGWSASNTSRQARMRSTGMLTMSW